MKLNAVAVSTTNMPKSIEFYELLGFQFDKHSDSDGHVETVPKDGVKLMIDTEEMIKSIIGKKPKPSNHSGFAIQFDTPKEVDDTTEELKSAGFEIEKKPWDAFWGQRYAAVKDPGGYMVDLYAKLT